MNRSLTESREAIAALTPAYYSPTGCAWHYLHMARGNDRGYLHGDRVRLKKYLYVLRPLLAVRWLESGRGVVPMPFHELVETLIPPGELRDAIERLLRLKQGGEELGLGAAHSGFERLDQGRTGASGGGFRRADARGQTGPGTARCPVSGGLAEATAAS